jgi:ABC-type uncharacterized transport system substrate-binding protein
VKRKVTIALTALILIKLFVRAEAQEISKLMPRVGFISSTGAPGSSSPLFDAFRLGLRELNYVEGKNISIERLYAEGRLDRIPALVNELVQQRVDIIMAANNVAIRAAKETTKTIPIVMISSIDPVTAGYVESFAHPGGNITGLAWLNRDVSAKRIELLKDLLPKLARLGVLWDADGPGPAVAFKEYTAAARAFKVDLESLEIRGPSPNLHRAFQDARTARVDALIVVTNPLVAQYAKPIFEFATKTRIPSMVEEAQYVHAGGLISYGASLADLYRRAAGYVIEILKGAKTSDLQVKLAERFEIIVNLNTAQQLGLVIPQHVLIQADKVIK